MTTRRRRIMRIFKEYGITAILAEPLLYHDRLLGVIVLGQQETARSFTEADRECLALRGTGRRCY